MSDKVTELKAKLFDINNSIANLQAEGQKAVEELKVELAKQAEVKEETTGESVFLQE